jgi:hypothetical protein
MKCLDEFLRRLPQSEAHQTKVENSEYLFRPHGSAEYIASYDPFSDTFKPGALVEMSVVFSRSFNGRCPGCEFRLSNQAPDDRAEYSW